MSQRRKECNRAEVKEKRSGCNHLRGLSLSVTPYETASARTKDERQRPAGQPPLRFTTKAGGRSIANGIVKSQRIDNQRHRRRNSNTFIESSRVVYISVDLIRCTSGRTCANGRLRCPVAHEARRRPLAHQHVVPVAAEFDDSSVGAHLGFPVFQLHFGASVSSGTSATAATVSYVTGERERETLIVTEDRKQQQVDVPNCCELATLTAASNNKRVGHIQFLWVSTIFTSVFQFTWRCESTTKRKRREKINSC